MSNEFTGDFEAAAEVRVEAINRILGSLHQTGLFEQASPKLLHNITARVGNVPQHPEFELAERFFIEALDVGRGATSNSSLDFLRKVQARFLDMRKAVLEISKDIDALQPGTAFSISLANFPQLFTVRGTAKAQLSTLSVSFPDETTSEATIRCQIRAIYIPDPNTAPLPEPIHGEVQIGFVAKYSAVGGNGQPRLDVKVTDDDSKIVFVPAPGTGLAASDAKQVARQIGRFARTKFEPISVELPQNFPFRRFKSLGAGNDQAIVLPFNPSGAHVPAFAAFPSLFLDPADHFAIAFRSYYIENKLHAALNELKSLDETFSLKDDYIGHTWATLHAWVKSVGLNWDTGLLTVVVHGKMHLWVEFIGNKTFNVAVKQKLTVSLDVVKQTFALDAVGAPIITGLPSSLPANLETKARNLIKSRVASALGQSQSILDNALHDINFDDALKPFDAAAHSKFTVVEIRPEGLVLRGTFIAAQRQPVVVPPADETPDGAALSAFKSWIPAGIINKFIWSWVSQNNTKGALPWSGKQHVVTKTHSFIFRPQTGGGSLGPEKPEPKPFPWEMYQMCLRVEGTQSRSMPGGEAVSGGSTCHVQKPEWLAILPPWWDSFLLVPVWGPDPGPEGILEHAMVAHINLRADALPDKSARTSSLIHFAGQEAESLSVMADALLQSNYKGSSVPVIIVLPSGSFKQTKSAAEKRLGRWASNLRAPLVVTEDYEGSWTRAFKATNDSSTYLLNGDSEVVWEHHGRLDLPSIIAVLNERVVVGRRQRSRPMRLALRPGESAPPSHFEEGYLGGRSSKRLQGRRALVVFWKSCSTPCRAELRRLQILQDRNSEELPRILGIGDGETSQGVAEICREENLTLSLIADPDRRIARQYGVNTWPTLVSINDLGQIDWVHAGLTHKGSGNRTF